MKTAIFVGGKGTRLFAGSQEQPKALVRIGDQPILWHLMKSYAAYGHREFVLCLGYMGEAIKEYFVTREPWRDRDFALRSTLQGRPEIELLEPGEQWEITFCDTGLEATKAERLLQVADHLDEGTFFATYGDGLADLDLNELLAFHQSHGLLATLTAVRASSQFGHVVVGESGVVQEFQENPALPEWINGGFFVFEREVLGYIEPGDELETEVFRKLLEERQIAAYRHMGFWACMDTYKDTLRLNELWESGSALWRAW